jgi:hypothetical protein
MVWLGSSEPGAFGFDHRDREVAAPCCEAHGRISGNRGFGATNNEQRITDNGTALAGA